MTHESQCLDFWPTDKDLALETLELLVHGMAHKLAVRNEYWGEFLSVVRNADRIALWLAGTADCDQFWHELINVCMCAHGVCGVLKAVSGEITFIEMVSGQETIVAGPGCYMERLMHKCVARWGVVEHHEVEGCTEEG